MGTASDDVVSVKITADYGEYVAGMKVIASETQTSMEGVKTSTQAAAGVARNSLGQFVKGAQDTAQAARDAGKAVGALKDEVGPLGETASHGSEGMFSLSRSIKEYRSEVRTEGRYSKFLAGDIASMGLASKSAASEITMFVSAFAFGGGIGVAVEVIKTAVKALMELNVEEEKFTADVKKVWTDASKAVVSFRDEINLTILALGGASREEQMWASKVLPLLKEQADLKQDLTKKNLELAEASKTTLDAMSGDEITLDTTKEAHAVELATEKLKAKTLEIKEQQDQIKRLALAQKDHDAARSGDEAEKTERQHQEKMLQIEIQGLTGAEKIQAEYVATLQVIDNNEKLTAVQKEEERGAEVLAYRRQLYAHMTEELKKQAEIESRFAGEKYRAELEATKKIAELNASNDKNNLEREKRLEKFNKDAASSYLKDFVGPVTAASASFFKGVLLQAENIADAMKGLFTSLAGAVIDGLVKLAAQAVVAYVTEQAAARSTAISITQGNIAKAATGAASAVASTPWVGPVLAAAAFEETTALLEAGTAPMLSAKGGMGEVPMDGMLFELHKKEMVMPEPLASGARNLFSAFSNGTAAPSAAGPREVHHHHHHTWNVQALDAKSFGLTIGQPSFQRELHQVFRTGRGVNG